jgi:large subunit ribosomal protein L29
MKIYQIREMTTDEIRKRILDEQKNLIDLRFQLELKNLTNTAKIKNTRKDIARMKTILKLREEQVEETSKESK